MGEILRIRERVFRPPDPCHCSYFEEDKLLSVAPDPHLPEEHGPAVFKEYYDGADRADDHRRYSHQRYDHEIKQTFPAVSRALDTVIRTQNLTEARLQEIAHTINTIITLCIQSRTLRDDSRVGTGAIRGRLSHGHRRQQGRLPEHHSPTAVIANTGLGRSAACRGAASFATASVATAVMPGAADADGPGPTPSSIQRRSPVRVRRAWPFFSVTVRMD